MCKVSVSNKTDVQVESGDQQRDKVESNRRNAARRLNKPTPTSTDKVRGEQTSYHSDVK